MHGPWYDAQVLGVKSLEKMMKNISEDAELSEIYTNHSIRATSITILDRSGIEARHIMSVSGHRSESSIRSYSRTDIGTKRKMSTMLSHTNKKVQKENEAESSVSSSFDFGVKFHQSMPPVNAVSNNENISSNLIGSSSSLIGNSDGQIYFQNCSFNF